MSIADNLRTINARIAAACEASGREPTSVRLLAVSKTKPESAVREALAAGHRSFGENYAQELRDTLELVQGASHIHGFLLIGETIEIHMHGLVPLNMNLVQMMDIGMVMVRYIIGELLTHATRTRIGWLL